MLLDIWTFLWLLVCLTILISILVSLMRYFNFFCHFNRLIKVDQLLRNNRCVRTKEVIRTTYKVQIVCTLFLCWFHVYLSCHKSNPISLSFSWYLSREISFSCFQQFFLTKWWFCPQIIKMNSLTGIGLSKNKGASSETTRDRTTTANSYVSLHFWVNHIFFYLIKINEIIPIL